MCFTISEAVEGTTKAAKLARRAIVTIGVMFAVV